MTTSATPTGPRGAPPSRVLVAGGGIGGLATALALAGRDRSVTVLERQPEFEELGAGIQLAPNGLAALERLGLGDEVRRLAVQIDALRLMNGVTGEHVASLPLDAAYRARFGHPYVVVHRGELHRLLVRACRHHPGVDLVAGVGVTGYRHAPTGVAATTTDGAFDADALVAADGVRSRVRAQLVGDGEPDVVGITVYRAVVPMERVPPELRSNSVTWWTGPRCHFVHYPIEGGRSLNLAPSCETGTTEAYSGVRQPAEAVREALTALGPTAHRLLSLGEGWRSWSLVDRAPTGRWSDGPVTLLGDAAHPMLHYVAQGACQALEDAVVLGDHVDGRAVGASGRAATIPPSYATAFAAYAEARAGRTADVQRLSRESIALWHAEGTAAADRDVSLAAMSAAEMTDRLDWLHAASGTRDPRARVAS